MGYPDPSDFRSGEPLAAWWLVGAGEGRTYGYATQGETANKRIQRELNTYAQGRLSPPLEVDGVIGARTLERLRWAALEHERADANGGYGQIAANVARDIAARTISPLTYRWGLWLAYVRNDPTLAGRNYGDVVITANTRLPVFGQAPDDDRDAGGADLLVVRWLLGVQQPPGPQPRSDGRVPLGSTAPNPSSSTGVTVSPNATTGGASTGGASTGGASTGGASTGALATTGGSSGAVGFLETQYAGIEGKYWLGGGVALGAAWLLSGGGKGIGSGGRRRKKRKGKAKK